MRAAAFFAAGAAGAGMVRMEERQHGPALPDGWAEGGATPRGQLIELTFAVRQANTRALEEAVLRVSTPGHADYGRHLSNEEVHALVAPREADAAVVRAFIKQHGAEPRAATPNGDLVRATVPVEVAERMLGAAYRRLSHARTGATVHRAVGGYSLPAAVAAAVDFVSPTVHVPGVRRGRRAGGRAAGAAGDASNTPKSLRALYNVTVEGKAATNKQAVTAFLKQYYSESDLQSFWKQYCSGITCGQGLPTLVGDATSGMAGIEAMLDIETITGIAGNVHTEFWGFSGTSPDNAENEPFMKWLAQVSSTGDDAVPRLFSTSYGEDENSWSYDAAVRLNTEFQKAGARGISLLYASGDEGANCQSSKFVPEGPASSPWVTAVGGTGGRPEEAIGLSSGGFSNYWPMPDWQKSAVAAYLQHSGLPGADKGYNTSGRAYPDIAAQAQDFCVVPGGCSVAGTSCATPTASGVIGLLNDALIQQGKPVLGYLNPWIYSNPTQWNDITKGSNDGCDFAEGWPAKKGWDAVTGVGTPNYAKLVQHLAPAPPTPHPAPTPSPPVTPVPPVTPAPPLSGCEKAMEKACGDAKGAGPSVCRGCCSAHADTLSAAGCTEATEDAWCSH